MKHYYFYILFALVAALAYTFQRKIEYLTVEEKTDKPVDRITKLEDDYAALHATVTSQEDRMKAATSQATEAQAFLNTPTD